MLIPLHERKQVGVLYHYTNIVALLKIIRDGLSLKDKMYNRGYISFSRNGNDISNLPNINARFIIDGDKISDIYKIKPDSLTRTNGKKLTDDNGNPIYKIGDKKQSEERIYGDNINIKSCLLAVEILESAARFDLTDDEKLEIIKSIEPKPLNLVEKFSPYTDK